ncbi:MAG: STAS domain-containing protein [Opitutae bacterium]|nr:STAS domain-containing protein [Opitutae bacterium]
MNAFQLETVGPEVRLRLAGEITVEHARALQQALLAALNAESCLVLDAPDVTRLDAAALQVLCAAALSVCRAAAGPCAPAVADAFRRFALENPFHQS